MLSLEPRKRVIGLRNAGNPVGGGYRSELVRESCDEMEVATCV